MGDVFLEQNRARGAIFFFFFSFQTADGLGETSIQSEHGMGPVDGPSLVVFAAAGLGHDHLLHGRAGVLRLDCTVNHRRSGATATAVVGIGAGTLAALDAWKERTK